MMENDYFLLENNLEDELNDTILRIDNKETNESEDLLSENGSFACTLVKW